MAYYTVESFAAGMDVRKSAATSPSGTLRVLRNAFVNPGGEIEKRQAFVSFAPAPAGSVGIMGLGDLLWSVGLGAAVPATSTTVGMKTLAALPGGAAIVELLDYEVFSGKFYTIVLGSDGLAHHHWDGALVADARGIRAKTYKRKMYRVDGQHLRYSASGAPNDSTGTGAGAKDLASEDAEMLDLRSLEVYYDKMAILSQYACQIWYLDPDGNKDQLYQTLRQAGVVAPKSVRQYGSGDILYLSQDGVRSLKAREQSLTASVSDIGSPIDPFVRGLLRDPTQGCPKMIALLEPSNGRYWLIGAKTMLVLANYPNPKISAWCVFDTPAFTPEDACVAGAFVYLRATTGQVYRYGSGSNSAQVFDNAEAEIVLPHLHFTKPATFKQFKAIDVACQGPWSVYASFNPTFPANEDYLGVVGGPTFLDGQFAMMGHSTHCSLRFRTTDASQCVLSSLMMHYDETSTS